MGDVISLIKGRARLRKALPKPRECEDCGDDIETARLQLQPKTKRCVSCVNAKERRRHKSMALARPQDVIIVRG